MFYVHGPDSILANIHIYFTEIIFRLGHHGARCSWQCCGVVSQLQGPWFRAQVTVYVEFHMFALCPHRLPLGFSSQKHTNRLTGYAKSSQ